MALSAACRLVFYITLGMACACLSYAELFFIPWMLPAMAVVVALLAVACRVEGRWCLSQEQANTLALVIAVGAGAWMIFHLPRSDEDVVASGLPWPAGLLPHVGPFLLVLLLVKVFRPKKLADFWGIQTLGLMMVTLSCILTGEPLFGLLLVAYVACLLWCLALFYWYREQPGKENKLSADLFDRGNEPAPVSWHALGLTQALRWTAYVAAFGLLLFLLAPRAANSQWDPMKLTATAQKNLQAGITSGIDLNHTGQIHLSDRLAFHILAKDEEGVKSNLGPSQRWRGETLEVYAKGRWQSWITAEMVGLIPMPNASFPMTPFPKRPFPKRPFPGAHFPKASMSPKKTAKLPNLGSEQFFVTFTVSPERAGKLVLAEPLTLDAGVPIVMIVPESMRYPLFHLVRGADTVASLTPMNLEKFRYRQVVAPHQESDMNPASTLKKEYLDSLTSQEYPREIYTFTWELLNRLPGLNHEDRKVDDKGVLFVRSHFKVAQILASHLSCSGEFTYSLNLRRSDRSLDPTVDFLKNVKEGHCARFAGALTLMLRSLGIPARVVQGYRGLDNRGNGLYYIRAKHAHSWVEALVPSRKNPEKKMWLTLDPTSSVPASEQSLAAMFRWFADNWYSGRLLWQSFILEYDTEKQRTTVKSLWRSMTRPEHLATAGGWVIKAGAALVLGLAGIAGFVLAGRIKIKRRARAARPVAAPAGFYAQLLGVLARRCRLAPLPAQTPREFAATARGVLQSLSPDFADVPLEAIALHYRVRYGGRPLNASEEEQIRRKVNDLNSALRAGKK